MKSNHRLRVGGVPEHFNLPWQLAAERDVFSSHAIDLSWTVYAGGTGAMTQALNEGALDIAILLTEGFIAAASEGLKASIGKVYIDTPLLWGIYTGAESEVYDTAHLFDKRIAISRFGSGSHLMSMIHASEKKEMLQSDQFEIVHSLHGGVRALTEKRADIFYWEKFMTRPHIHSGELRQVGEFNAPWSSFLIVVSHDALQQKREAVLKLLEIMTQECIGFKQDTFGAIHLSKRFDMSLPEARKWLMDTQWNYNFEIESASLHNAKNALCAVGKCNAELKLDTLCAPWLHLN